MTIPPTFIVKFIDGTSLDFPPFDPNKQPVDDEWKAKLKEVRESKKWKEFIDEYVHGQVPIELQEAFHLLWTESAAFIRREIEDDNLLLEVLQTFLPPYTGDGQWLYRGENLNDYEADRIGFCWTPKRDTAKMFARGRNAFGKGGVLLKAWAPAASILAEPCPHSKSLDEFEFVVNAKALEQVEEIETYPPTH